MPPPAWVISIGRIQFSKRGAVRRTLPISGERTLTQWITARTQAATWTMIQYSAAISGIGGVSRWSRGWLSST
jgi:hypothetical protein